ncbi:MAG: hypothetical protein HPY80_07230 [Bacteroidales bacterium]|jgi:hypothetical protein|nr:hypothetical protein [Bacteroidales bacterium]NPV36445.1 hypothetical protein [Bacteroidales bacterium]
MTKERLTQLGYCLLIFVGLSFNKALLAQSKFNYNLTRNWYIGLNSGATIQFGELGSFGGKSKSPGAAASVFLGKQITPWLSIRGNLMTGNFKGQDLFSYSKAKFYSYQLTGLISLSTLVNGYKPERAMDVYAQTGAGFIDFQSDVWDNITNEWLAGYGHGYGKGIKGYTREWVFPAGLGVNWRFYKNLNLNFEASYWFLNTDRLDGDEVNPGKDRGLYTSLGISYRFNVGRLRELEPLNYQASADKISFKYKNLSQQLGKTRRLRDGAKPSLVVEIPSKIGAVDSFNIVLKLKNDGISGVADIDIVIPQGFQARLPRDNGLESSMDELVGNIYTTLPTADTTLSLKIIVYSGQAPVGSHPFYIGYKVIDASGETAGEKKVYYVEKDLLYSPDGRPLVDRIMGVEFRVQLTSSRSRIDPEKLAQLYPLKEKIFEDFSDGFYQYTAGSFKTAQEADRYKEKLASELGLSDLYVVFFQNGTRISSFKGAEAGKEYLRTLESSRKTTVTTSVNQSAKIRPTEYRVEIRRNEGSPLKISELQAQFETPEPITEIYQDGVYYYFAGRFANEDIARAYREYLSDRYGMVSAKVVPLLRGKLIASN